MTQVTVTKTRAARKTTTKVIAKPAPKIAYVLHDYARPVAGARLAAHTAAFLTLSGMASGAPCPSATAIKVIGPTAVKYHRLNGNWESTAEGLKLTAKGVASFASRGAPDPELFAAYQDVLVNGTVNAVAKSADQIVKLA